MSCFSCGRSGHFARECADYPGNHSTNVDSFIDIDRNQVQNPSFHNNEASNGPQRCYRCNEFGHIARECLSDKDIRACYNCGQHGHLRTECNAPLNPMLNMNNNSRNNSQCYRCGQYGHFARDCSIFIENNGMPARGASNGIFSNRVCFNCSRTGHIATACPEMGPNRTDNRDIICYTCNRPGHLSRNCPDSNVKCFSCGLTGHMARDCLNNRIFSSSASIQQQQQQSPDVHMPIMN